MSRNLQWKVLLIGILIVLVGVYLYFRINAINLGLDLQGGLHLVLDVQVDKVIENELVRIKDALSRELRKERIKFDSIEVELPDTLKITASTPEDLAKIDEYIAEELSNFEKQGIRATDTSTSIKLQDKIVDDWQESAVDQAYRTIENRVNEIGLKEPVIQRQGKTRIIVELAGEKDPQQAINILQTTAQLRFQLVKGFAPTKEDLLKQYDSKLPEDTEILPGDPEATSPGFYLLEKEAKVTGANLKDARVSSDDMGLPAVSFEFDREGSRSFGKLTEENIGQSLAIVLDKVVQSAPVIRSRITDRGQITGSFTSDEARDLAIVLRAGALPAPVKILQNISVGPSLGEDSIQAGRQAIMIGSILVIVFMLLYYKGCGLIADISLILNLLFIIGFLASVEATLTLPGLAGIALTVGMAVDANVLIFERIKEELRRGKTTRAAVEKGFSRALWTILDANLTTLIAAIVLFQFGTGPIKGFAVTLSVGIVSTLFTVLILSKVIFDLLLQVGKIKQLSI